MLPRFRDIYSPKVATMIIRDDVISDVISSGSTIREDHIDTPYRRTLNNNNNNNTLIYIAPACRMTSEALCSSIVQF